MARYIDADMLREKMFHEAFEKDTIDQKWDSGCWIRYYLFENTVESIPTADVVEVVRCKDCEFYYEDEKWCIRLGLCGVFDGNDYCSHGERRE